MSTIRPIQMADLPAILALSERTGTGLTTLPANRERLQDRIDRSVKSFAKNISRAEECYVFVLIDHDAVVGISAIEAAVGLDEPWYNYHVGTTVHASRDLDVYNAMPTLFLANDHTGHTELCSLFLDANSRQGKNGALLSKARLLFIAEYAERFGNKLIAELRGKLDSAGRSPFWESLGRHFFSIDFSRADYLTGTGQKVFIAELMPRYPLYTVFLPKAAQDVIGQVHEDTLPAKTMLEAEGFRYEGYVDIFDAGPTVECYRENVDAIRRSRVLSTFFSDEPPAPDSVLWLVSNRSFADFRACLVKAPQHCDYMTLSALQADELDLAEGDTVRAVPLAPRDRLS